MRLNKYSVILLLLVLVSCAQEQKIETIKIGVIASLTGPAAFYGEAIRDGIDLAVKEVNEKGGINGKQIEVVYEDDGTDATKATTAFQKLVNVDEVSAMVGGTWDFNYNAIAPLAQENKVILITPANPKTKALIMNDYTFVMIPDLKEVTKKLENFLQEQKIKKVAVVHFVSPYGEEITTALKETTAKLGGELVLDETYPQIGGNDFLTTVLKVKKSGAEAVFIDMVGADIAGFIKRARENEMKIQIIGHGGILDAATTPSFERELLTGVVYFDYNKPVSEEFIANYKKAYGKEPKRSADRAYDSVIIIAEGLKNAEKDKLKDYIENNEFSTINGKIKFKNHVATTRAVFIEKVTDKGIETLETKKVEI